MNESRRTIERILQTEPTRVSDGELDGIGERVLHKLHHSNPDDIIENIEEDGARAPHQLKSDWWKPVAATVLIAIAGVGVYAIQRSGFFSTRQVVPPEAESHAPSVSGAPETLQISVLTPGSTKPGATPSREETFSGAAAQIAAAQATDAGAARPKFAVASVRPTLPALPPGGPVARGSVDADLMGLGIKCLGADGLLGVAPNVQDPTARRGRCTANSVDIREVILRAYPVTSSTVGNRLVGFPTDSVRGPFQIEGVADEPERVTKGELQQMLQALLADRFKLRVHLETREVDGYTLTIAKSGIKFKETSGDARCRVNYGRGPNPANPGVSGTCPMGQLTTFLTRVLNPGGPPPFEDKTGLMGTYNMEFAVEEVFAPPTASGVRGVATQQARQFIPPIPKALEEQLGLHLERAKVPTEFLVIDHIEQPTEN